MRTAPVRELKNKTSELLRLAATEDIVITSHGRPVACLVGIQPNDITVRPRARSGNYADPVYRKEALRLVDAICKLKPDKGKRWVSQDEHDRILYGDFVK